MQSLNEKPNTVAKKETPASSEVPGLCDSSTWDGSVLRCRRGHALNTVSLLIPIILDGWRTEVNTIHPLLFLGTAR